MSCMSCYTAYVILLYHILRCQFGSLLYFHIVSKHRIVSYRIVLNIILRSCALWSGGSVRAQAVPIEGGRVNSERLLLHFLFFSSQEYNFLSDMILPHFCRPFSTESMNMEMRQTQDVTAYVQRRLQVPTLRFRKLIWGESDSRRI